MPHIAVTADTSSAALIPRRKRARACTAAVAAAVVLVVSGFGASPARAAETLSQAWALAIAHDQSLAAAGAQLASARADERAARAGRWPTLTGQAGYTRLNASPQLDVVTPGFVFRSGPLFGNQQFVSASVQMRFPLYTGGRLSASIAAAHQSVLQADAARQSKVAGLKLEVASAYVAVLRARSALKAAQASVSALTAQVADAQAMVAGGQVSRADLLSARVALAEAQQQLVTRTNAVQLAVGAYNRLLGEPLDRSPVLQAAIVPVDARLQREPLSTLLERAESRRTELKGLGAEATALSDQASAAGARARPQVALTGGYLHLDNRILDREDFATVGVGVSWSLFDGGQARARADALRSASRAARSRLRDARSKIELQVQQAWLNVRAAQARLNASRAAVAQAQENLRIARELYRSGTGTSTRVLQAVALQETATGDRDNARLDQALALLELEYAVGAL